jgi:hypothetical protein
MKPLSWKLARVKRAVVQKDIFAKQTQFLLLDPSLIVHQLWSVEIIGFHRVEVVDSDEEAAEKGEAQLY